MSNLHHGTKGTFILKGSEPRQLRHIRLTDSCWDGLKQKASKRGISRPDLIEEFAAYPSSVGEVAALHQELEELKAKNEALNQEVILLQGKLTQALNDSSDCAKQKEGVVQELNRLKSTEAETALTIVTGEDGAFTGIRASANSNENLQKMRSLLSEGLKLPANKGGAIKVKIKEALALL